MESNEDYKNIPGWGMDSDPENEPTYPIKNYTGDDHNRTNYERSEPQPETVEILMSNERPKMTTVFGTSVPPSGLSGVIRRYAFKHSEDRYRHWLPLLFADRINMFEGLIDDIKSGHLPNIVKERGWAVEWQYNRSKFVKKIAVTALITGTAILLLRKRKK
ncbi:hypothetical protein GS399_19810 [Pedobacter sp. HMF7647]|uniref:Uncharacterized protein n=1 Tax=Hufsiella arboris TaxID=2695275 RepID=A0A7K1YGA7_9SPHI|nr:hypothetical protein [Hufsiella arboris]MXV53218.1 hypothetical protein [Hufsiella arboris]